VAAGLKVFQDCLVFVQPQLLRWLLAYISWYQSAQLGPKEGHSRRPNPMEGFSIAPIMFVASVVQIVALNQACPCIILSTLVLFTTFMQYFQRAFETGSVFMFRL
jgi:hypothetical protein